MDSIKDKITGLVVAPLSYMPGGFPVSCYDWQECAELEAMFCCAGLNTQPARPKPISQSLAMATRKYVEIKLA
jgi:hypothetical protein